MFYHYDADFYEYRAIAHLAEHLGIDVHFRVRLPDFSKPYHARPELDGLVEIDGAEWAIEVKSYPVSGDDFLGIYTKYKGYHFRRLKIIAPLFESQLESTDLEVEFIEFQPELSIIRHFYSRVEDPKLSPRLLQELRTGKHHFRYRLAGRAAVHPSDAHGERKASTRFINQTDKRIKSWEDLQNEILYRTPRLNPPIRIYWSTSQWLSPKDLFFGRMENYRLGGPLVFDVDGSKIHRPFFSCVISHRLGICEHCFWTAKQHTLRLLEYLHGKNLRDTEAVFSGRQGFHVYLFRHGMTPSMFGSLLESLQRLKIKVDTHVSLNVKGVITFPGTVHGHSMRQLLTVTDLPKFSLSSLGDIGHE